MTPLYSLFPPFRGKSTYGVRRLHSATLKKRTKMETENDIIIDDITKEKISQIPILDVARELGLTLGKRVRNTQMCNCFVHPDSNPSMGLNLSKNLWHCFTCGAKGNLIGLVMQHEHIGYLQACKWLIERFHIPVEEIKRQTDLLNEIKEKCMNKENDKYLDASLIEDFKSSSSDFTTALVQSRILTHDQMKNAAAAFRLGCLKGNVLFCYIDLEGHFREGKIMAYQVDAHRNKNINPCSLSYKMKKAGSLSQDWKQTWCLFGLHQLADPMHETSIVAIVESEKTAIICSELLSFSGGFRICWMATGGKEFLKIDVLRPLIGRRVIVYPDTDPTGETFRDWQKTCQEAGKTLGQPFTVSDLLEKHATPEQKSRKIDIADFITQGEV